MKYFIEVSPEQLRLISRACELLARIHIGQLGDVADEVLGQINNTERFLELKHGLEALSKQITNFEHPHAYFGITMEQVDDRARQAFDIHQVLRYIDAWDRFPEGGIQVYFDKPMRLSAEQDLPIVRKEQISPETENIKKKTRKKRNAPKDSI